MGDACVSTQCTGFTRVGEQETVGRGGQEEGVARCGAEALQGKGVRGEALLTTQQIQ